MKALVLMFLAICLCGISLRYCSSESKAVAFKVLKDNLITVIIGLFAISVAIFFSVNTTLKVI